MTVSLQKKNADAATRHMGDFAQIWKGTKGFEGGYQQLVNDSANYCPAKGKPGSKLIGTKFGISAIAYGDYFHRCPTVAEIKNLSPELAQKIAKTKFWDPVQGDKILSQPVAHLVFDSVYGSGSYGPLHTRKAINKMMGSGAVKEFKSFTLSNEEISKINGLNASKFFDTLSSIRKSFFKGLTYEKGYMNRMAKIVGMYANQFSPPVKVGKTKRKGVVIVASIIVLGVGIFVLVRRHTLQRNLLKSAA